MLNLAVGQTRTYKKLTCRTSNWLHEILLGNDSHSFSCRVKLTKNKFGDLSWDLPADLISKSVAPKPRQKVCKHSNCFNCQSLQKELKIYIKKKYFHKKRVFCVDLLPFQYNPTTQPEDACFRVISPKNVLCLFYSCEDQTPAFCSHAHDAYFTGSFLWPPSPSFTSLSMWRSHTLLVIMLMNMWNSCVFLSFFGEN